MSDEVLGWFVYHPADSVTGPMHDEVRRGFSALAKQLINELPNGPDKTRAMRKLQDAMMSANACIANSGE